MILRVGSRMVPGRGDEVANRKDFLVRVQLTQ